MRRTGSPIRGGRAVLDHSTTVRAGTPEALDPGRDAAEPGRRHGAHDLRAPVATDALRLEATEGDFMYAVSEVQVFGIAAPAVP
jgi:hypothetical protein